MVNRSKVRWIDRFLGTRRNGEVVLSERTRDVSPKNLIVGTVIVLA